MCVCMYVCVCVCVCMRVVCVCMYVEAQDLVNIPRGSNGMGIQLLPSRVVSPPPSSHASTIFHSCACVCVCVYARE